MIWGTLSTDEDSKLQKIKDSTKITIVFTVAEFRLTLSEFQIIIYISLQNSVAKVLRWHTFKSQNTKYAGHVAYWWHFECY